MKLALPTGSSTGEHVGGLKTAARRCRDPEGGEASGHDDKCVAPGSVTAMLELKAVMRLTSVLVLGKVHIETTLLALCVKL